MIEDYNLIYSFLLQIVGGAALATCFYHFIIYMYQKEKLFLYYALYLFVTAGFIAYRIVNYYFYNDNATQYRWYFSTEEVLQCAHYYCYFLFGIMAFRHYKALPNYMWRYWKYFLSWSLPVYGLSFFLISFFTGDDKYQGVPQILSIIFRAILMISSLVIQVAFLFNATNAILRLILIGSIVYLGCGVMAFVSNLNRTVYLGIPDIAWIFVGIFSDILFFSAAMGARLKGIAKEQRESLLKIQQQEIEKIATVYATQEKERRRISQELHDDIGSTLSSIALMSTVLKNRIPEKPDAALVLATKMEHTSREMIETMSDIVWSNNPANDTIQHLHNRLQQYLTNAFENSETVCSLFINKPSDDKAIDMQLRRDVYLICKEIINNASKYSHAHNFLVRITFEESCINITAADDGEGFDAATIKPGNGLNNIRQRIKKYGGQVQLATGKGMGAQWAISIPL
jgi:signal transduction histidine kinase